MLAGCASAAGRNDPGGNGAGGGDSGGGGRPSSPSTDTAAVTSLTAIAVGKCIAVTLPDGAPAIVARPAADRAVCYSAICTHQGCTVLPNGAQLDCPCHGSRFD